MKVIMPVMTTRTSPLVFRTELFRKSKNGLPPLLLESLIPLTALLVLAIAIGPSRSAVTSEPMTPTGMVARTNRLGTTRTQVFRTEVAI